MEPEDHRARELAIPAGTLGALRASLVETTGSAEAERVLEAAGVRSGASLEALFRARLNGALDEVGVADFWQRLGAFLRERGWGTVDLVRAHTGVALLTSPDWAEAEARADPSSGSCLFSVGLLSGLLEALAGRPVAVLEVGCRSGGDEACRFAFGSEAAIGRLGALLGEGRDLDDALESL